MSDEDLENGEDGCDLGHLGNFVRKMEPDSMAGNGKCSSLLFIKGTP